MSRKHFGSNIDEFMKEEGIFEEAQAQAVEEVVASQLAEDELAAPPVQFGADHSRR